MNVELIEKMYAIRESGETNVQKGYLLAPILCGLMDITPLELSQSFERLAVACPELMDFYEGGSRWCSEQSEVVK